MNERDKILTCVHHVNFMLALCVVKQRLFYLENNFSPVIKLCNIGDYFCTCCSILFIGEMCADAGIFFNKNISAESYVRFDGVRSCRNTVFFMHNFFWDSDNHR